MKIVVGVISVIACITSLLWPAIWNGYPLLYSDSASYLASGFTLNVPVDRPIAYGLFVNVFSFGWSLWGVIITQAILVFYSCYLLFRMFVTSPLVWTSVTLIGLSFTTGLAYYTSQIMADVFCSVSVVGFLVLSLQRKQDIHWWLLLISTVFGLTTHFSNVLVIAPFVLLVLSIEVFRPNVIRFGSLIALLILPITITLLINYSITGRAFLSETSNIFITARMVETGVVKSFLSNECDERRYPMCDRVDDLPFFAHQFLWTDPNSPLYDADCMSRSWAACWKEKNDDFGLLVKEILFSPNYLKMHFVAVVLDFSRQLTNYKNDYLEPQSNGSNAHLWIEKITPNDVWSFKRGKQFKERLYFEALSKAQNITIALSFAVSIMLLIYLNVSPFASAKINWLAGSVFGLLLINAFAVVCLSTVLFRYQGRVIWMIPLVTAIMMIVWSCRSKLEEATKDQNPK